MQPLPFHPTPKYQKPYQPTNHHPCERDAGTQPPRGRLLPGMLYYIEDARVLLLSRGVDVIFVGLGREVNGVEHGA